MARLPAIRELDARQEKFVGLYVEGGNAKQAALDAGYSESTAKTVRTALLASSHIAWAVAVAVRQALADAAPMALRTLKHLAENAESEKTRAECAKALLDRAGYVAPRATAEKPAGDKPLHEQSTNELQTLAARLEDELAGRAKPLSGAAVVPDSPQASDLIG